MKRFFHPIVKAMRGSLGVYLQTLALLLFAVAVTFAGEENKKYDCNSTTSTTQQVKKPYQQSVALSAQPAPDVSPSSLSSAQETDASAADYYLWETYYGIWSDDFPMTAGLCQQWADLAEQDKIFVAVRFPAYPPTLASAEPYTLPVVMSGPYSPTVRLTGTGPAPVLKVPLEVKPERADFLEKELPAAPGEHWLALGAVTTPTITCPAGLNIPSGAWHLNAQVFWDFGGALGTFADRVLTLYHCYEGQAPPPGILALAANIESVSYRGRGITCLGPRALRLVGQEQTAPPFTLYSSHMASITPTQTISFSHSVANWAAVPVTLTLTTSSTLGLTRGIYSDAAGQVPITGPIRLGTSWPGRVQLFWLFVTAPPGTPSGTEALIITARDVISPARSTWTSDLLWVGAWRPPSLSVQELYLPVLLKGR